mmetsp:Transcript_13878/g.32264  ORF Transcript_13878/g.32264 Transcript_13878/m.32264 type:complete len:84 (-) Transcript_13878:159-410(-)
MGEWGLGAAAASTGEGLVVGPTAASDILEMEMDRIHVRHFQQTFSTYRYTIDPSILIRNHMQRTQRTAFFQCRDSISASTKQV